MRLDIRIDQLQSATGNFELPLSGSFQRVMAIQGQINIIKQTPNAICLYYHISGQHPKMKNLTTKPNGRNKL